MNIQQLLRKVWRPQPLCWVTDSVSLGYWHPPMMDMIISGIMDSYSVEGSRINAKSYSVGAWSTVVRGTIDRDSRRMSVWCNSKQTMVIWPTDWVFWVVMMDEDKHVACWLARWERDNGVLQRVDVFNSGLRYHQPLCAKGTNFHPAVVTTLKDLFAKLQLLVAITQTTTTTQTTQALNYCLLSFGVSLPLWSQKVMLFTVISFTFPPQLIFTESMMANYIGIIWKGAWCIHIFLWQTYGRQIGEGLLNFICYLIAQLCNCHPLNIS